MGPRIALILLLTSCQVKSAWTTGSISLLKATIQRSVTPQTDPIYLEVIDNQVFVNLNREKIAASTYTLNIQINNKTYLAEAQVYRGGQRLKLPPNFLQHIHEGTQTITFSLCGRKVCYTIEGN